MKVFDRFENKKIWNLTLAEGLYAKFRPSRDGWLWGYFIYRTAYGPDEDLNQALAKLYRYIQCTIQHRGDSEAEELVRTGCKNVIVEDRELLEGASPTKVRNLFNESIRRETEYNSSTTPRSALCSMIDNHALRSILTSLESYLGTRHCNVERHG